MRTLRSGEVILNRFKVEELVAGAGQAACYRGIDQSAGRPWQKAVLIKQYRDSDIQVADAKKRDLSGLVELLKSRLRKKKNYFSLPIAVGDAADSVVGVFEYIDGESLDHFLDSNPDQKQRARCALAVSNVVRFIHDAGIAHLDLHPGNFLVERRAVDQDIFVRLIDFDAASIDGVVLRDRVIGKPFFRSPEHHLPEVRRKYGRVSAASDVFSLGVLLFEILFEQHPLGSRSERAIYDLEIHVPRCSLHHEVVDRVLSCLRFSPGSRPQARWVHSTLHKHFPTLFGVPERERWSPIHVRLQAGDFVHATDRSIHLGERNFRGSGANGLPARFLCLHIESRRALVELTDDSIDISLSGRKINGLGAVPLSDGEILTIGGVSFSVSIMASDLATFR